MFPCIRVVYIVLVAVGLPLKAHSVIWLVVRVARLPLEAPTEKADNVLDTVPQVKRHIQHFAHLHRVDVLVS